MKRALSIVAGLSCFGSQLWAQQAERSDVLVQLNRPLPRFSSLTLSESGSFSFAKAVAQPLSFGWMETAPDVDLPPLIVTARPRSMGTTSMTDSKDSKEAVDSTETVEVRRTNPFDYVGGEVGVMYGRSSGKFGHEFESGYITGEVGDDKFHISAGAAFENSTRRR